MAEQTNISWCNASFNCWEGCTNVSPGCDHCYAEVRDNRFNKGCNWGNNNPRKTMSENYWKQPKKWNLKALNENTRPKVFCGSLCDVFDNNAPDGQRERLWKVIKETPYLNWLLLTKRAPNIKKYLPNPLPPNIWLGVSVENKKHGLPRIDILRNIPAAIRFLSIEPLLEDLGEIDLSGIGWVIIGGESGNNARPMNPDWVYPIIDQCVSMKIPVFFKQWGGTGKDKGGSLIDGVEHKHWPKL